MREPLTVSHTSLYHAMAEAADHFGAETAFTVAAIRRPGESGLPGKWELTVTPVPEPASVCEKCGLVDRPGGHRKWCPANPKERCGSCGGPDPLTCVTCRVVGS